MNIFSLFSSSFRSIIIGSGGSRDKTGINTSLSNRDINVCIYMMTKTLLSGRYRGKNIRAAATLSAGSVIGINQGVHLCIQDHRGRFFRTDIVTRAHSLMASSHILHRHLHKVTHLRIAIPYFLVFRFQLNTRIHYNRSGRLPYPSFLLYCFQFSDHQFFHYHITVFPLPLTIVFPFILFHPP